MRHLKKLIPLCLSVIFILRFPAVSLAESRIFLKDGRVLKVEKFWREEGMVKYESFGGIVGIPLGEVDHIITPDLLAFEEARKVDTVQAYEGFIRKHPRSEYADRAKQRIKALEFEDVKRINSAPVYLAYIRRNPNSIYLDEAKEMAEMLIFQDAARNHQEEKYKEYLEIYPEGKYTKAAKKALEILAYQDLVKSVSIPEIKAFLREYPESSFRRELEDRIAFLVSEAEAKAEARAKREQATKARKLQELEIRKKHRRWAWFLSLSGLVVLSVVGALFFFWKKKRTVSAFSQTSTAAPESGSKTPESGFGIAGSSAAERGPIRYEDMIGVPRRDDTQALPEPEGPRRQDPNAPASLPAPGQESEVSEGEDKEQESSPFLQQEGDSPVIKEDAPILLGDSAGDPSPGEAHSSDSEVDLSDHETEFKLDLKDVPQETESPDADGDGRDTDVSQGDLPDLFEDDETRNRRGGGPKV